MATNQSMGSGSTSQGAMGQGGTGSESTNRLIASNRVEGTAVYNRRGERLGSVDHFMVDKYSGQVAHAVMSFGGFLGMGESYHPLPWKVLDYDTRMGGYVVDLDKDRLQAAPAYRSGEDPFGDPSYGRTVYGFYGVPYYM